MALLRDGTRIYGNATIDDILSIDGAIAATSNITGSLKVAGGIGVTGNVFSTGNITSVNANLGNLATANYFSGVLTTASQPNITSVGTLDALAITGTLTSGNANLGNAARANYFIGDGSSLTNVIATGLIEEAIHACSADTAGTAITVTASSQPNITSVGNLTTLTIVGTITVSGDSNLGNSVRANYFVGNGGFLTYIDGANVTQVANANYATYAGTVVASSQSNITSVGSLTSLIVTGNASAGNISTSGTLDAGDTTITGNLTVTGTFERVNVTTVNIKDPIVEQGGNPNGAALTSNDGKDRGQLLHYYAGAPVDAFMGWDNSNAEFAIASNVSITNDVITYNTFGNIRANYYIGNGSTLENLTGGNVTGQVGNALVAGTVYASAQSNITSVGTLTSLAVTGNISSGNANLGNLATANYFTGNGSLLTGVAAYSSTKTANGTSNVDIPVANGNVIVGVNGNANIIVVTGTGANVNGYLTVNGNILPNANSTYSLGSPTARWNNLYIAGQTIDMDGAKIEVSGSNLILTNPAGGQFIIDGASSSVSSVAKTISENAQPNITSVGTLTSLSVTGNISSGNANLGNLVTANYFTGNGSLLTGVAASSSATAAAVANGTSNVNIPAVDGNATISVAGNANIVVVTGTGVNVAGYITSSGNISSGNANLGNLVTANYFTGNGSLLTGVARADSSDSVANGTSNVNIPVANGNATISVAGNSNIAVITGTGVNVAGYLTATGNIKGDNANLGNLTTSNYFTGVLTTENQPNITTLGNLTNLIVTGNINLGNGLALAGNFGNIGQILTATGVNTAIWTNKFFVGNVPPQASSITPNYGDCWFYVDDTLDPPASRLYMWLSDGTSDFFYDFLPPNF